MARKITGLMITLGLDATGVEGGFNAIDKAISKSMTELKKIDKALKFDPTNTELLAQKQEVLAEALEKSRQRLKGLEDAQNQMAKAAANNPAYEAAYEPLKKQLDEADKKMKKLQSQKEEMDKQLSHGEIDVTEWGKYRNELKAAEDKMKDLEDQKKKLDERFSEGHITAEEYRFYKRELEQVRIETKQFETQLSELYSVTDKSSEIFDEIEKSIKKCNNSLSLNESELKKVAIQYSDNADSIEGLTKKQKLYESSLDNQNKKLTLLNTALEKSKEKYGESADETFKWQKEIADSEIVLSKTQKELDKINKSLYEQDDSFDEIEKSIKKYNNALNLNESELKKISVQYSNNAFSLEKITKEQKIYESSLETQKQKLNLLNTALEKSKEKYGENADETFKWKKEISETEITISEIQNKLKQLENVTDKSSKAFRKAVESTKEYQQAMDKLKASSSELKGKLNEIWNFALKVSGAITSAALAAGAAATKVGTDFDASMSVVQAYSKAAGTELEALRDAAKEMGATTSKTASEAAEGLSYMALAGWDTQKMLTGLEPMLRASEAANADLGLTSDLVTDSMSAMGVSVEELTHYLDICAEAQSDSNTSMIEMLQAYVGAGGMFKNLNTELDESATLIGILANKGIKGSEAGSALNSILINLIGANKNAASAMDALGVSAYDANGKFIGITETLRLVSKSLETVSEEDRNLFTSKIGGKTQYDTLMALLNGINDDYDKLFANIQNSNGALERTAEIMRDNLKGDVTMLTSALQDLGIEVNDTFTESFREAVQTSTKEVSKLSREVSDGELNESLEKIAKAFAKLIEQIVEFSLNKGVPAVINLFEFIADNGAFVKGLIIGIGGAFAAWKIAGVVASTTKTVMAFNRAVKNGATATKALTKALGVNPWVALVGAIAAVAAGFITMALNADTANNRIRDQRNEIKELDKEVKSLSESTQKSINRSEAEIAVIEKKAQDYEALIHATSRDADEEEQLKDLANELQQYMPESIKLIDEQTRAYNSLAGAIDGVILSMKKNAYVQIYNDQMTELVTKQIEAKETLENLQKERDEAEKRLLSNGAIFNEHGEWEFSNPFSELANWGDVTAWKNARKGITEANESLNQYENEIENLGEKLGDVYSEFNKNQIVEASADGARIAAEGMIDQYQQAYQKAAEEIETEQKDLLEAFQADMDDLDSRKNIHTIDDASYWNERRQILNKHLLKETEEWWKYYDETEEHFSELTAAQKEEYEQQISNQAEALKERKELNDDFTDKMYYDELETVISALNKESDLYKKYNSEILKGRKDLADDLAKETVESTKNEIDIVSNAISETQAEYKEALDKTVSDREAYKQKLMGMANLYTSDITTDKSGKKSGSFTLENIDEQIKTIEAYDDRLKKLEAKGAGEGLTSYIGSLSDEDSDNIMHALESMTNNELKIYSDKYDKLIETVNKRAEARYNPQIEEINKNFTQKLLDQMGTLPDDMAVLGQEAISGFIAGFTGKPEELIEAVTEKCNAVIEGFKNGLDIHSPSKETEKLGEYAGAGFEKGLEKISGADAAEKFADDFILKMAEKDKELHNVLFGAFAGNTADAVSQMNANVSNAMSNIIPSLQLPDITKLKLPKSTELSLTAQKADERVISRLDGIEELIEKVDTIITLVSMLISQTKTIRVDLTSTNNTYLDGKLIATEVTKKQKEMQRMKGT